MNDEKESFLNKIISELLAGKISIAIYILMFIYLVILPLIAFIPLFSNLMPSTTAMLIGDNYTSVLAALGASIAAGSGVAIHAHVKKYTKKHQKQNDELGRKIQDLSDKLDQVIDKKH
ncbi:MAG: hypothetical protein LBM97_00760 [Candidatus Nomurabacteria bacterium]|jgi:hypothetical protein|nr:hypothetical protein [Candidatus Nomurabacteria bacterium]